ncbi:MAG: D-alanyl-D-alanine carboxypeptidase [Clostridia bacterium]|nr:D-alanyl-D-alanine carboxypeptidase [Clostridia bacterium]
MKKNRLLTAFLTLILSVNTIAYATGKASPSPSPSASPKTSQTASDKSEKASSDKSEKASESKSSFPVPNAEAAIVIDSNSGDVIYALDADKKVYPAGTSNIMTAMLALENKNLADTCSVTEEALANITYDQPQLGMKVGETYTVEQLLYAIILNSNNDAANVLAISVAGSLDAFVQQMNEKAAELGLSGTHYANPTGYQNENHYTTAADTATLAQYAMKNPTFSEIVKVQKYTFPPTSMRTSEKTILSTNHLVSRYKYPYHYYANATGIKSGNSKDAGYCLAASAVKGTLSVISVVMGCPNADAKDKAYSFVDTKNIFDYVFENYQSIVLAKKGDVIYDSKVSEAKNSTRLALTVEEDIYTTLKKTADPEIIENEVTLTAETKAPINQGDLFGTVTYSYNGRELKTVNLVAANEVKRDFILHMINSVLGFIFHPVVLIIIILILAIWVRMRIIRNRKRRLRHSRMVSQSGRNAKTPPRRARTQRSSPSNTSSPSTHTKSYDHYKWRR